jgi:hypothetical protein
MVKAEKGGLLHSSGLAMRKGRGSTQLMYSHLWVTDMSYRLNRQKNWDKEQRTIKLNSLVTDVVWLVS